MTCFLEIEELVEGCFPKFAYEDDACFDLIAAESYLLNVGKVVKVSTGIKMGIPKGFEVQIRPRSGMALNHSITVVNSPGTIDSGYQGEVMVLLTKLGSGIKDRNYVSGDPFDSYYLVNKGDRIAQACIKPVYDTVLQRVEAIKYTGRDGLGHTGK